jgi:histidyl-tRNA synthetase
VEKLKAYFKDQEKALCEDCRVRLQVNPLRILDCKEAGCQKIIDKAPASADNLCSECKGHFEEVVKWLGLAGIKYKVNHRLVRGLDYYTRTTFEVVSRQLGAQNAVCGGGRYDTLVEELGGKATPAAGFAIGMDRLVEVLKSTERRTQSTEIGIYIATLGEEAKKKGFEILIELRRMGISADMDYIGKSLKAQLKAADQSKARFTLILGEEEIKTGMAKLKNMQTTEQEEVKCDARTIAAKLQLPK